MEAKKGACTWETEIAKVGPGGKIGEHTHQISAVQARKAVTHRNRSDTF